MDSLVRYEIIKFHTPTATRTVLASTPTRSEADKLRKRFLAKLTPTEIQAGYSILIEPRRGPA